MIYNIFIYIGCNFCEDKEISSQNKVNMKYYRKTSRKKINGINLAK